MSQSAKHEPDPALVEAITQFLVRVREQRESPGHEFAVAAFVEDVADRLSIPVPTVDREETHEALAARFYGEAAAMLWAFQAACGLLSEQERDHVLDLLDRLIDVKEVWKLPPARHIEAAQREFRDLFHWLLREAPEPLLAGARSRE